MLMRLIVDLSLRFVPFFRFPEAFEGARRCGFVDAFERLNADPFFAGLRLFIEPDASFDGALDMAV